MLLRKLFRTLWHYKAQFISMVIMIALGVGVFLGFNIEWYSLEVDTAEIYESTGFADYRIYSDKGFSEDDLEKILAVDGVEDTGTPRQVIYDYRGNKGTFTIPDGKYVVIRYDAKVIGSSRIA